MFTITISEQINGYTYLTASNADMGITANYILYHCSDEIIAELDTANGFEPDYILVRQGWSADGYLSTEQARQAVAYHFDAMIRHYRAWLGL